MDVKWSFKTKKTEQNKKLLSDPFLIRTIQRDVLNKRYGHKNERVENVQGFERQGLADDDVKQIIDDLYTSWGFVETSVNRSYERLLDDYQLISDAMTIVQSTHKILSVTPVIQTDDCQYHKVDTRIGSYLVDGIYNEVKINDKKKQISIDKDVKMAMDLVDNKDIKHFIEMFVQRKLYNLEQILSYDPHNSKNLEGKTNQQREPLSVNTYLQFIIPHIEAKIRKYGDMSDAAANDLTNYFMYTYVDSENTPNFDTSYEYRTVLKQMLKEAVDDRLDEAKVNRQSENY